MNTLICGPPCAGKTTLALQAAESYGGSVLDWDEIAVELTGQPLHTLLPYQVEQRVEQEWRGRASSLGDAWLIRTAPRKQTRAMLSRIYAARIVVLPVSELVCLERLAQSQRPSPETTQQAIAKWWKDYQPGSRDMTSPHPSVLRPS